MTHDFKKVLEEIERIKYAIGEDYYLDIGDANHIETVYIALRIADRLQSGKVSDEMIDVGEKHFDERHDLSGFKAMAKQMIKECEDE